MKITQDHWLDNVEKILSYHTLSYHTLTEQHLKFIRDHDWVDTRFDISEKRDRRIYCSKCKIVFGFVLYKHQRPDNTKWHELTCDEILIKKLLE